MLKIDNKEIKSNKQLKVDTFMNMFKIGQSIRIGGFNFIIHNVSDFGLKLRLVK